MSRSLLPESVERYLTTEMTSETPLERRLRAETATLPDPGMQIGADQGRFMAMLIRLLGARRCLEVGTFTGYSALVVAAALPDNGTLVTCDISEEWTAMARRYWNEAGLASKIELILGPATETLATLLRQRGPAWFDFAFIDADKARYDAYYEACLQLVRPHGLLLLDNTLWHGAVADPSVHDADTDSLRTLNQKMRNDPRVETCLLSIGDGVTVARKR